MNPRPPQKALTTLECEGPDVVGELRNKPAISGIGVLAVAFVSFLGVVNIVQALARAV